MQLHRVVWLRAAGANGLHHFVNGDGYHAAGALAVLVFVPAVFLTSAFLRSDCGSSRSAGQVPVRHKLLDCVQSNNNYSRVPGFARQLEHGENLHTKALRLGWRRSGLRRSCCSGLCSGGGRRRRRRPGTSCFALALQACKYHVTGCAHILVPSSRQLFEPVKPSLRKILHFSPV